MTGTAKSASQFGTFRKRKIEEFIGENLVLLNLELVTSEKDGKPLKDGPYCVVKICIDSTGEMAEFLSGQQYLMGFYQKVMEAGEYPVNFRILKPGKAYEIGDWE